jgi:tRNA (guanine-N7-)-methyltransferase
MLPHTIKSFIRREGNITASQKKSLEQVLPSYALPMTLLDLQSLPHSFDRVVVEIGFGMGDALILLARDNPSTLYLGIEVYSPGIGKVCMRIRDEGITNIRLYTEDAVRVLSECLAENTVDAVLVFFPDPWHKKRHHKRRLVQLAFIEKVWRVLKVGGVLHMATDWENYALHMQSVMQESPGFAVCAAPWRPPTKYEQRGERLGHGVWDLAYRKFTKAILCAPVF